MQNNPDIRVRQMANMLAGKNSQEMYETVKNLYTSNGMDFSQVEQQARQFLGR